MRKYKIISFCILKNISLLNEYYYHYYYHGLNHYLGIRPNMIQSSRRDVRWYDVTFFRCNISLISKTRSEYLDIFSWHLYNMLMFLETATSSKMAKCYRVLTPPQAYPVKFQLCKHVDTLTDLIQFWAFLQKKYILQTIAWYFQLFIIDVYNSFMFSAFAFEKISNKKVFHIFLNSSF